MKTIYEVETVDELFNLLDPVRGEHDRNLYIPTTVYIVFRDDYNTVELSGEGSESFILGNNIDAGGVIEKLGRSIGRRIHITWINRWFYTYNEKNEFFISTKRLFVNCSCWE